jgi:hypothetical protein
VGAPRVTTSTSSPGLASGSGSPLRSCRRGPGSHRRSLRCCRCCTCTACPAPTSVRRWSSSWSLNSRHHPEQSIDGVASTIVRDRSTGQCLETAIHHMAREPIRSTTEVARVTLRHTRRSESLEVPSTLVGHIDLEVGAWWVERNAICVIGDATVMWTSAGTARSGRLKPRLKPPRRSRSPVGPVGTGKIWPASGGRSRGPAPAAIRGL